MQPTPAAPPVVPLPSPLPASRPTPTRERSSSHLGPTVSGFPTFLAFLAQLIPLQRSLLLLNLQKAHYHYATQVKSRLADLHADATKAATGKGKQLEDEPLPDSEELSDVTELLKECGLWSLVRDKEEEADAELDAWGPTQQQPQPNGEFQVVQLSGLPFLLHLPPGYEATSTAPPSREAYKALKRAQAILHILTTLLQLVITYQPSSPAIAYGRALLRPPTSTSAAANAGAATGGAAAPALVLQPQQQVQQPQRRRATISIVINLEAFLQILIPLLLLSLKLAFLLWIFGRHAGATKRLVLFAMAAGYVVWEGWAMQRRRAGAGRERIERELRRRVQAAALAQPAAVAGDARPAANGGAGAPRLVNRLAAPRRPPPLVPGAPVPPAAAPAARVREPTSRLTPRYWLNWVAAFGLASEAHELGLVPRSIAGRPVAPVARGPPPNAASTRRRRALRTALVAFVLFFGTLSPEVEKKRKRALEKRERLLAQRKVARERRAAIAVAAAAAGTGTGAGLGAPHVIQPGTVSGSSTPGVYETPALDEPVAPNSSPIVRPTPAATIGENEADAGPSTSPTTLDEDNPAQNPGFASPRVEDCSTSTNADSPSTPGPSGRTLISDTDLFADGLGEPDQVAVPGPSIEGTLVPGLEGGEDGVLDEDRAVVEGRVEDETDDEEVEDGEGADGAAGEVDQIVALF